MAMGKTRKATQKPETPESRKAEPEMAANVLREHDRVASVSWRADGTPDQSESYEVIDDDAHRRR